MQTQDKRIVVRQACSFYTVTGMIDSKIECNIGNTPLRQRAEEMADQFIEGLEKVQVEGFVAISKTMVVRRYFPPHMAQGQTPGRLLDEKFK